MMAAGVCGRSCVEQAKSPIAEPGGFFQKLVSALFGGLNRPAKRPSSEPEHAGAAERVVVVVEPSTTPSAPYEQRFAYSADLLATIVMGDPFSAQILTEIPEASRERADLLMMAVTLFYVIVRANGWKHDSVNSRMALALSISTASKFVMDTPPFGPVYALSRLLRADELPYTPEQLLQFIFDYECRILNSLPIYKCYFNHYSCACEFVAEHALCAEVERLQSVCLLAAYNATELLGLYCSRGEWLVGPAIGVLSMECAKQSGLCKCEYSVSKHAYETYQMAVDMGTVAAASDLGRLQRCFGHPFTDPQSLERKSTTQMNMRKATTALCDARAQCLPPGNGQ